MRVDLPGDTFTMGSDDHYPEEAPTHPRPGRARSRSTPPP